MEMKGEKIIFIFGLVIAGILGFLFFFSLIQLFLNLEPNSDLNSESRKWLFNTITSALLIVGVGTVYALLDRKMSAERKILMDDLEKKYKKTLTIANFIFQISIFLLFSYTIIIAYSMVFISLEEYIKLFNPFTSFFSATLFLLLNIGIIMAITGFGLFLKIDKNLKKEKTHN